MTDIEQQLEKAWRELLPCIRDGYDHYSWFAGASHFLLSARRELTEVKAQRDLYKQCLDDLRGAIDKRLKGLTQ